MHLLVSTHPGSAVLLGLGMNSKVVEALLLLDTPNLNTSCGAIDGVTDGEGSEDCQNLVVDSSAALENSDNSEFSEDISFVFFSSFCSVLLSSKIVWQSSSLFDPVPMLFL